MRHTKILAFALVSLMLFSSILLMGSTRAADEGITIEMVNPKDNSTISNQTPLIVVSYYSQNGIDTQKVKFVIDESDMTDTEVTTVNPTNVTYQVVQSFKLKNGQHNVTVTVVDKTGITSEKTFSFIVDANYVSPGSTSGVSMQEIAIWSLMALGIGFLGLGVILLYLYKTRKFTLKKYFAKHPVPLSVFIGVIPAVVAVFFVLFAFAFFQSDPKTAPYSNEYIVVIAAFIALLPYALYAQLEKRRIAAYERAFSQFLFEMADAMRGGIDPAKALVEISKNDNGILAKHLQIAAAGIGMGRPFEEMINVMVKPIKSKLVKRYASLVGESAKVGGEISLVVHRAAKDMDDLIKITEERSRNLMNQATTIYIAFGVLIIILYQLISIYPSLGQLDMSSIGGGLSDKASAASSPRMDFVTLKKRFLDLVLINAIGNGLLIGLFTTGKAKYGLLHGLIMVLAALIFFIVMIL